MGQAVGVNCGHAGWWHQLAQTGGGLQAGRGVRAAGVGLELGMGHADWCLDWGVRPPCVGVQTGQWTGARVLEAWLRARGLEASIGADYGLELGMGRADWNVEG